MSKPLSTIEKLRRAQPEKAIQKSIRDYLTLHGWQVHRLTADIRPDAPHVHAADKEEPGTPDLLAFAGSPYNGYFRLADGELRGVASALIVYIEVKRPGEKLSKAQEIWHAAMRADEWTVIVAHGIEDVEWMTK